MEYQSLLPNQTAHYSKAAYSNFCLYHLLQFTSVMRIYNIYSAKAVEVKKIIK